MFKERLGRIAGRPKVLILRMRHVPAIDSTALHALRDLVARKPQGRVPRHPVGCTRPADRGTRALGLHRRDRRGERHRPHRRRPEPGARPPRPAGRPAAGVRDSHGGARGPAGRGAGSSKMNGGPELIVARGTCYPLFAYEVRAGDRSRRGGAAGARRRDGATERQAKAPRPRLLRVPAGAAAGDPGSGVPGPGSLPHGAERGARASTTSAPFP